MHACYSGRGRVVVRGGKKYAPLYDKKVKNYKYRNMTTNGWTKVAIFVSYIATVKLNCLKSVWRFSLPFVHARQENSWGRGET